MKTNKKLFMTGVSLMIVSIIFIGCLSQNETKNLNAGLLNPIFKFNQGIQKGYTNGWNASDTLMNFSINIENPNDEVVKIQLIYLYVVDGNGNLLYGFKSISDKNFYVDNEISMEEFNLTAHENITLNCIRLIYHDQVSEYFWNLFGMLSGTMNIEGLYRLNGELQWFEVNS